MKKNIIFFSALGLFLAAMVSIATVSCTKEGEKYIIYDSTGIVEISNANVVGKWSWSTSTKSASITFKSDYTCTLHYEHSDWGSGAGNYNMNGYYMMTTNNSGQIAVHYNNGEYYSDSSTPFAIINGKLYIVKSGNWIMENMSEYGFSK